MRFAKLTIAAATACAAAGVGAFAPPSPIHQRSVIAARSSSASPSQPTRRAGIEDTALRGTATDAAAAAAATAIDATIAEAGSGVALFGKSGCPFCKKAKRALYGAGVHPVVVELDVVENGPAMQKALEDRTGKATVPNVWLDGKFLGGSEEVISGLEDGTFDGVEKKEVIVIEDEEKVPIVQGPDCIKVGDLLPKEARMWTKFGDPEAKVDLLEYTMDKSIVIVGLPGKLFQSLNVWNPSTTSIQSMMPLTTL